LSNITIENQESQCMKVVVGWIIVLGVTAANPSEGSENPLHIQAFKIFLRKLLGCMSLGLCLVWSIVG
jgi:hypothetical protein